MPYSPNLACQVFQVFKCNSYISKIVLSTLYIDACSCINESSTAFLFTLSSFSSSFSSSSSSSLSFLFAWGHKNSFQYLSSTLSCPVRRPPPLPQHAHISFTGVFPLSFLPSSAVSFLVLAPASHFFFPSLCPYHLSLLSVIVIVNEAA